MRDLNRQPISVYLCKRVKKTVTVTIALTVVHVSCQGHISKMSLIHNCSLVKVNKRTARDKNKHFLCFAIIHTQCTKTRDKTSAPISGGASEKKVYKGQ